MQVPTRRCRPCFLVDTRLMSPIVRRCEWHLRLQRVCVVIATLEVVVEALSSEKRWRPMFR